MQISRVSIFLRWETCRLNIVRSEQDCVSGQDAPVYEGPIGEVGKEPHFGEPKPKWYNCETLAL